MNTRISKKRERATRRQSLGRVRKNRCEQQVPREAAERVRERERFEITEAQGCRRVGAERIAHPDRALG